MSYKKLKLCFISSLLSLTISSQIFVLPAHAKALEFSAARAPLSSDLAEHVKGYAISIINTSEHPIEITKFSTQDALKKLEQLISEKLKADRELKEKGLDIKTFTVYWMLKKSGVTEATAILLAGQVDSIFQKFVNWQVNPGELRQIRIELTKLFVNANLKEQASSLIDDILKLRKVINA